MSTIEIDPVTRIEGHLKVTVEEEDGRVTSAYSTGMNYRGFENFLKGKSPFAAVRLTSRICGVCPIGHTIASTRAIEGLYEVDVPVNAQLVRNIIQGANLVADNTTHFYAMWGPDMVNPQYKDSKFYGAIKERFAPLKGEGVKRAVIFGRRPLHEVVAIFGGRFPHPMSQVPGGATCKPGEDQISQCLAIYEKVEEYFESDVLGCSMEEWLDVRSLDEVLSWLEEPLHANSDLGLFLRYGQDIGLHEYGAGPGRFLSYGWAYDLRGGTAFKGGLVENGRFRELRIEKISEDVTNSYYKGRAARPMEAETKDDYGKEGAYSWAKAPRYDGKPVEVGPFSREIVNGGPLIMSMVEELGPSVFTRMVARLHETVKVLLMVMEWIKAIDTREPFYEDPGEMKDGLSWGLWEAPRGALGHWLVVEDGLIHRYQVISPTTWNLSPRDAKGVPGPIEQALVGTPIDPSNPVEVGHVVRSYAPCVSCSIHTIDGRRL